MERFLYVTLIAFTRITASAQSDESSIEAVNTLLAAWRMNGQICGREWSIVEAVGGYSTVVLTPECDACDAAFNSRYATAAIVRCEAQGLQLTYQNLGEDVDSVPSCSCLNPSGYALFTTFLSLQSPVRCIDCFHPVALYRFKPMASGEFSELISWQSDYQSCDSLQMNCTVLERAASREVANVDSQLTAAGLAHCKTLAAASELPFYYYLQRSHGRGQRAELKRRCPSCAGEWHLAERLHGLFDFKCDRCHLLSNVAFEVRA